MKKDIKTNIKSIDNIIYDMNDEIRQLSGRVFGPEVVSDHFKIITRNITILAHIIKGILKEVEKDEKA